MELREWVFARYLMELCERVFARYLIELWTWVFAILCSYTSGYLLSYGAMGVDICCLMDPWEWVFAMSGYLVAIDAHRQFPAAFPSPSFLFLWQLLAVAEHKMPLF